MGGQPASPRSRWRSVLFGRRSAPRQVVVYSRANCPLCDEALKLLEQYRHRHRLRIEVVDIEGNATLEESYGERIPVVRIDGRERFYGRIDRILLERLLDAPTPKQDR